MNQKSHTSAPLTLEKECVVENVPTSSEVPPRSLAEAIVDLPRQYIKVLTKPSVETFTQEMGKARWSMVWIQLAGNIIISVVYLLFLTLAPSLQALLGQSPLPWWDTPLGTMVTTPLVFFIEMGLFYLLARAFGGQGTFLAQCYVFLLLCVPLSLLGTIGLMLGVIPFAGVILFWVGALALGIYEIVLLVYALMAVHRLNGGKATGVFLMVVMLFIVGFALLSVVAAHLR
jgi:hypothetical protein